MHNLSILSIHLAGDYSPSPFVSGFSRMSVKSSSFNKLTSSAFYTQFPSISSFLCSDFSKLLNSAILVRNDLSYIGQTFQNTRIESDNQVNLHVERCKFVDSVSTTYGGAILFRGAAADNVRLLSSIFINCRGVGSGGAVSLYYNDLEVKYVCGFNCRTTSHGHFAVFICRTSQGIANVSHVSCFYDETLSYLAGTQYHIDYGTIHMQNLNITGQHSKETRALFFFTNQRIELLNSVISGDLVPFMATVTRDSSYLSDVVTLNSSKPIYNNDNFMISFQHCYFFVPTLIIVNTSQTSIADQCYFSFPSTHIENLHIQRSLFNIDECKMPSIDIHVTEMCMDQKLKSCAFSSHPQPRISFAVSLSFLFL